MGSNGPVHDLYCFSLGAYIMIVMSSFLNTIVQNYQILTAADGGRTMVGSSVKPYILNNLQKVKTINTLH